jgi:hypothetical protein
VDQRLRHDEPAERRDDRGGWVPAKGEGVMAKKKESKNTKGRGPGKKAVRARAPGAGAERAATVGTGAPAAARATEGGAGAAGAPRECDPRLPPAGTVLQKRDRHGKVRCECTVAEDGIHYAGKVLRSLSGAAMAAAKDLGLTNKTQNGWVFWGVTKPPRAAADPLATLDRAWERYHERATSVIGGVTDENREQVRETIDKHADAIAGLRKKVA